MEFTEEDEKFEGSGGKLPPHSIDAEKSVLGAILIDNEILNNLAEILKAEDLYKRSHQIILEAMFKLWDKRDAIDIVTLSSEIQRMEKLSEIGGVEYLGELFDTVPSTANSLFYARIIREMALRRRVIAEASAIARDAFSVTGDIESFIDSVEQRIFAVSESKTKSSFKPIREIVKESIKQVEYLYNNKGIMTGVESGFYDLDQMTFGFQPSDLIIIAGRPSMGKTALVLCIAKHAAINLGKAVAFFSLEMSHEQISMRLLCSESKVSSSKVRSGRLEDSDFPRIVDAASRISGANLFIDDTPAISVTEMRAKARRLHRETPLSMIIVDYLQLMRGSSRKAERREQEISEISRSLKGLAKELNIPVLALSQLNRGVETRTDKRPIMADLRESGAIEQDADIIGFIYRDEVYNPDTTEKGIAEIIIGKHRNGPTGTVKTIFQGETNLFLNLEPERGYDYLGSNETFSRDI